VTITAQSICNEAAELVAGPRAVQHGDKSIVFSHIARLWTGYMEIRSFPAVITKHDVACMMELMKIARRFSGKYNRDDYVDAAGYAGCAGEIAAKDDIVVRAAE